MTHDRDPALERIFDDAKRDVPEGEFTDRVMSTVDGLRRKVFIAWIIAGLIILPIGWLISAPAQDAVQLLLRFLPTALIEVETDWVAQFLAPVNSMAAVFVLGFVALRMAYKRIFSS